jgi:hypothetical protein
MSEKTQPTNGKPVRACILGEQSSAIVPMEEKTSLPSCSNSSIVFVQLDGTNSTGWTNIALKLLMEKVNLMNN